MAACDPARRSRALAALAAACMMSGAAGCASRSLDFSWRGADGAAHTLSTSTRTVLVRLSAGDLREDIQTAELVAGTRAGALGVAPDSETIQAIARAAAEAAVRALLPTAPAP
jgi:replication-associated recombination protein RarA